MPGEKVAVIWRNGGGDLKGGGRNRWGWGPHWEVSSCVLGILPEEKEDLGVGVRHQEQGRVRRESRSQPGDPYRTLSSQASLGRRRLGAGRPRRKECRGDRVGVGRVAHLGSRG